MESNLKVNISVIVPVYNEENNLLKFNEEVTAVLSKLNKIWEIIYINDGSDDESEKILSSIAVQDQHIKVINFRRNFGQTAALSAGINLSKGEIIIPIDADLQNDPRDIPKLLEKIEKGYDVVSGWRKNRKDKFFSKRLPSMIANKLISVVTGVRLHDYGCTLKAYKREVIKDIKLYGEMHRFIPVYTSWMGGKIEEIIVNHRPRVHGRSKYGIIRTFKVLLDLITIKFLSSYAAKPLYLFGGWGLLFLCSGFMFLIILILDKFLYGVSMIRSPLLLLSSMLVILSFQFFLIGLLAEIMIRTYHEAQNKNTYTIKDSLNI
ncbi:glycosyltransferase family 2 protein [bacterium]|nr:glycosyltransferase family 2 protein [bacterium]MBU0899805.1 glycosyltransferase family 2 protein [bacterium]MBU1152613.1 glycosyltransferase family 2 protein [bacterium]MBU1782597.1 glycosyltransferase family 2 protein [bacterium]MBU2600463.1 glycosyltransferase family 2 protein [bacterium]